MDDRWKEEFDDHMVAVQNMTANSLWPAVAIACALCDKGLIEKRRLLDITEAILGYVRAEETGSLGEVDETVLPLERFRDAIEQLQLQPGQVLHELQTAEAGAGNLATLRLRNSKRRG